jgi:large-conductance mechanosensitive channel
MKLSFPEFLITRVTVIMFITVIVNGAYGSISDGVFEPIIGTIIDPKDELSSKKYNLNSKYDIYWGKALKKVILTFLMLVIIWAVTRYFF